jgi:cell division protein FtsQ
VTDATGTMTRERPVIEPRIQERRVAVIRHEGRRRLRVIAAVVVAAALVAGGFLALHSSLFAARRVIVRGARHTSTVAVVAATRLGGHPPLIDVDTARIAARVEALPWVAGATVTLDWPDAVTVTVSERIPVAAEARPSGGVVLVDTTGRVLAIVPTPPAGVPVLRAPDVPGPPGSVLGGPGRTGLTVLAALPASLRARVTGVDVGPGGQVTLALIGGLDVDVGAAVALPAKFDALTSVLADAPPPLPAVIDVTVPDAPSVGPPEPSPGTGPQTAPPPSAAGPAAHPRSVVTRFRGPS